MRARSPRETPPRIQAHPAECGSVSLGIVLEFHGWDFSPLELREMCGITRDGASVLQIQQGARLLGWNCIVSKRGLKSLETIERPVIIHWDFNHFLVLEAVADGKAYLNDPALGHRIISVDELSNHYTGICLELFPPVAGSDRDRPPAARARSEAAGFRFPRGIRWVAAAPALVILFIEIMQAGLGRAFYDFAVSYHLTAWGFIIAFIMLALTLAHLSLVMMRTLRADTFVLNLQARYRERFVRRLMRAPLTFHEGHFSGELVGRVGDFGTLVKHQIQRRNALFMHGISGAFCLLLLCVLSPLLALVSLGPHLAMALLMRAQSNAAREANIALKTASSRYEALVGQRLTAMPAVSTMGMQFRVMTSLLPVIATLQAAKSRLAMLQLPRASMSKGFETANLGIMAMAGYYLMVQGQLGYGGFIFALAVSLIARADLDAIMAFWKREEQIDPIAERCGEISQQLFPDKNPAAAEAPPHGHSFAFSQTSLLSARGVGFGHDGTPSLFHGIDLDLGRGEILGLRGPSGCGKSTLLELLSGQRPPTAGSMHWNHGRASPRERPCGYVFSDGFLVSGTLAGLLTGSTRPDLERLSECLEIVELRDKLAPFVHHGGDEQMEKVPLSRGELQRLALAQALFHSDDCVFFDEAFSHLSGAQSQRIIERIRARGTSMILAGHRNDVLEHCDRIVEMNPVTGRLEAINLELAAA